MSVDFWLVESTVDSAISEGVGTVGLSCGEITGSEE